MPANYPQCRYLRRNGEMCTAEALDPTAEVLICSKHASRVMALIKDYSAAYRKGSRR